MFFEVKLEGGCEILKAVLRNPPLKALLPNA